MKQRLWIWIALAAIFGTAYIDYSQNKHIANAIIAQQIAISDLTDGHNLQQKEIARLANEIHPSRKAKHGS